MRNTNSITISIPAALHLVDLILEESKRTENEQVKKVLLRAGIKIADLVLAADAAPRRSRSAA